MFECWKFGRKYSSGGFTVSEANAVTALKFFTLSGDFQTRSTISAFDFINLLHKSNSVKKAESALRIFHFEGIR